MAKKSSHAQSGTRSLWRKDLCVPGGVLFEAKALKACRNRLLGGIRFETRWFRIVVGDTLGSVSEDFGKKL